MSSTSVDRLNGVTDGVAIKAPCRVATTANITLSGLQTIDGVTVIADDRVLVKDQTDTTLNGIYAASSGPWTRTTDFDGSRDIVQGTIACVFAGTVGANTFWQVSSAAPYPGTAMTFSQFALSPPGTISDGTVTPAKLSTGGPSWDASGNLTPVGGIYAARVASVASAATVNLSAIAGNFVHITGTTTITAITMLDGQCVTVVFDGILTLTHGASLLLPGAANITTAADMIVVLQGDASSVARVVAHSRQASSILTSGLTQATARLIGRTTAGTGAPEEISVGSGLSLSAGSLSASAGSGAIAQIVRATWATQTTFTDATPFDNTIPQNTEGAERFTVTMTPTDANSTLEIEVVLQCTIVLSGLSQTARIIGHLHRDATSNAIAAGLFEVLDASVTHSGALVIRASVSAAAASSTTFKVRSGRDVAGGTPGTHHNGATALFGGVMVSRITITEILP